LIGIVEITHARGLDKLDQRLIGIVEITHARGLDKLDQRLLSLSKSPMDVATTSTIG